MRDLGARRLGGRAVRLAFRLILTVLLVELAGVARAASPVPGLVPDPALALTAALALWGRSSVVLPGAAALAILRLPTTLASPLAELGAVVALAWALREGRRFANRERAAVAFAAGALLVLGVEAAAAATSDTREPLLGAQGALAAVVTGAATALAVPALRGLASTRRLVDRRLGEAA